MRVVIHTLRITEPQDRPPPRTEGEVHRAKSRGKAMFREQETTKPAKEHTERHFIYLGYPEKSHTFFPMYLHNCLLSKGKYRTLVPTVLQTPRVNHFKLAG